VPKLSLDDVVGKEEDIVCIIIIFLYINVILFLCVKGRNFRFKLHILYKNY